MTITYPYSLATFADKLRISSVIWSIQRGDEMSGSGDGRFWQAELTPPLWMAEVTLTELGNDAAKQIAALIRKLHGAQEAFFLYDPVSQFPQADKKGLFLGSSVVTVGAVGGSRRTLSLLGLPGGYVLTLGDKIQIPYGSDPTRYAFLEISETVAANGSGVTGQFEVFPHVPTGVGPDQSVILKRPACKVIVQPGSHNPGTAQNIMTEGATFKVIQKK
ncbi:hypothetical protein OE766_03600 [Pararhizobium sp. YC-54]|uniref:hypothetical protein n=1 Tax=Pararhizobium sp. YC-54 TaxID=2986920 RepID=UPI0021F7341D|nr:hypothetical protein [Pararhizobium sp. YC-54]MCV9997322.1 hypothetical protein [Pararhizobium sp. YC-54]